MRQTKTAEVGITDDAKRYATAQAQLALRGFVLTTEGNQYVIAKYGYARVYDTLAGVENFAALSGASGGRRVR